MMIHKRTVLITTPPLFVPTTVPSFIFVGADVLIQGGGGIFPNDDIPVANAFNSDDVDDVGADVAIDGNKELKRDCV